jgi:long-chain acyl-CoA synthetase
MRVADGERASVASRNLARLGEETLARLGDHPSLVFEGHTFSAAQLQQRARRVAGGLIDLGVRPGDRVVVLMANCPEVLIAYDALWRAGAVITPVVFLVTAEELGHILRDSGAVGLLTSEELLGSALRGCEGVATLRHVIVVGDVGMPSAPATVSIVRFGELEPAAEGSIVDRNHDDLAALMYTGGTTGRAKGVALSHGNLWWAGKALFEAAHVPGLTRTLVPLPLSHAYGLLVTVAGMHTDEPGLAVVQRWFNPSDFLELCATHRIQRTALVPTMIQMLLAFPLEECDLSALRIVGSGSAPLAPSLIEEFERRVPGCEILEGYGCTESGAVATANSPGRRRVGSVGTAVPGYSVRIVDDDGRALAAGADGEVCVQGPGIMAGYWHAPEDTNTVVREGWLHTGDIGHVDGDGYLYIVDRKKDLILRGGFNVFPRDVEEVMLTHPDVTGAAVVGRPDSRLGEEVVAFVTLRTDASAGSGDLIAFARTRLAANKYPREVRIVDHIPITSVGKLDRKALRARLTLY